MKYYEYKMGIKFDKDTLAVEQTIYSTKFVNDYIDYDLDVLERIPFNNFKLKNCLVGANNIIKNNGKEKWVYSAYGIAFDGVGSWSSGNDGMLQFLMLKIVYYLILIIARMIFKC